MPAQISKDVVCVRFLCLNSKHHKHKEQRYPEHRCCYYGLLDQQKVSSSQQSCNAVLSRVAVNITYHNVLLQNLRIIEVSSDFFVVSNKQIIIADLNYLHFATSVFNLFIRFVLIKYINYKYVVIMLNQGTLPYERLRIKYYV